MNSNNQTTQDYFNLPVDQQILDNSNEPNIQHALINNAGMSNTTVNTLTSVAHNIAFEFYLPLPNDTRIYHVTYTELHPLENARILNNAINLSHVPDHQFQYHYNIQQQI